MLAIDQWCPETVRLRCQPDENYSLAGPRARGTDEEPSTSGTAKASEQRPVRGNGIAIGLDEHRSERVG
jgi:hypothetical protein